MTRLDGLEKNKRERDGVKRDSLKRVKLKHTLQKRKSRIAPKAKRNRASSAVTKRELDRREIKKKRFAQEIKGGGLRAELRRNKR